jgi:molecular chaperone GrpE
MSNSRHGLEVVTVLLHASPKPTPTPAPASDTGLLIVLLVVILVLAIGLVTLALRLRRRPAEPLARGEDESARGEDESARWSPAVQDRTEKADESTGEPDRRASREAGVALDQRDILAMTCMDVAERAENDALSDRLKHGLEEAGYEILVPTGGRFDPRVHEAVDHRPTEDPALDRVVAATTRPGYRLDGQIVRYAKVVVYRVASRPAQRA